MNLCRPDESKSCAACCGLYNVSDGTKPTLLRKLEKRTHLFQNIPRSIERLTEYEAVIRASESESALDLDIHVCEFTGFLDHDCRIVGCLLHPSAPGNNGVDLRGLCHYGSIACKSFFCPAWDESDPLHLEILLRSIDDWHLYGLVVADLGFVCSLFGLLEESLGGPIDLDRLFATPASQVFMEMLSWKDSPTFSQGAKIRRSPYYQKRLSPEPGASRESHMAGLLESLRFGFNLHEEVTTANELVMECIARFRAAYNSHMAGSIMVSLPQKRGCIRTLNS